MDGQPTHAARKAFDRIADKLKLDLDYQTMLEVAQMIDEEYADVVSALGQVWEDFGKHGELKVSTIMRMKSGLAYVRGGDAELEKMLSHTRAPSEKDEPQDKK